MFSKKIGCSMFKKFVVLLAVLLVFVVYQLSSQIKINEVCSSNDGVYYTHNHEDPDWIELYNTSDEAVNLSGWRIYDKYDKEKAFILPDTTIAANSFIVINCTGESRKGEHLQIFESKAPGLRILNNDACDFYYLALKGDISISCQFHNVDFYEPESHFGIMFRSGLDSDDTYASIFLKHFWGDMISILLRHQKHNWVNHHNTSIDPDFPNNRLRFDRRQDSVYFYWQNNKGEWTLHWKLYFVSQDDILAGFAIASNNPDNATTASISDIEINGEKYDIGDFLYKSINHNRPAKRFISNEVFSDFKISTEENVYLWDTEGNLIDEVRIEGINTNNSIGRFPDGAEYLGIMLRPSPGRANNGTQLGYLERANVDVKPGKYFGPQQIKILNNYEDIYIYYTTDGSEPSDTLEKYSGEIIEIESTSVLKVKMYKDGYISGGTEYFNYILNETTNLPVIAVSSDPDNFFAKYYGIFNDRNIQRDIEIPGHFHYFNSDGSEFYSKMGIKTHGSTSKLLVPMKSMRFYARNRYGDNKFQYPFFNKQYSEYKRLVLRNAGQDWYYSYLRDVFVNLLALKLDSNLAAAIQPCVVYLNGKYWGLMYLQERVDEKMISSQYDINDDDINTFEDTDKISNGSFEDLESLLDTLELLDLSNPNDVEYVKSRIDINNFCNYGAVRFFSLIIDWPCLNQKYWQSDEMDSKYRWIVYDSDISCALSGQENNFGNFYPPNCLFAKMFNFLIKDEDFRTIFINHYCDLLNTVFDQSKTLSLLDSLSNLISPEINRHREKWEESCDNWENHINKIRDFLRDRQQTAFESMVGNLFVYETTSIRFVETDKGRYKINSIIIEDYDKEYRYFRDVPVTITAIPDPGYQFKQWKSSFIPDSQSATFNLNNSLYFIEAEFYNDDDIEKLIINEIMYNNSEQSSSGDWFELYNPNPFSLDIENWVMMDDNNDHKFTFPIGSQIEENGLLVVCSDSLGFDYDYPEVLNKIGYFDFGLGKDDMIRIYDQNGVLIDSVIYSNLTPWDSNADGTGNSLELISVGFDNSIPENWKASINSYGTPGQINSWEIIDIPEGTEIIDINVYPNPATDYIIIEAPSDFNEDVTIMDMYGRTLLKTDVINKQLINIKHLVAGTYFIRVFTSSQTYLMKLMKIE